MYLRILYSIDFTLSSIFLKKIKKEKTMLRLGDLIFLGSVKPHRYLKSGKKGGRGGTRPFAANIEICEYEMRLKPYLYHSVSCLNSFSFRKAERIFNFCFDVSPFSSVIFIFARISSRLL